jgi:hypothetical protein
MKVFLGNLKFSFSSLCHKISSILQITKKFCIPSENIMY